MGRDAQQTFYYHNRLLLRFLILATAVFVLVVTSLWWQERGREVNSTEDFLYPVSHFSEKAAMAEATSAYVYGATYIHDIEQYPEIKERFFGSFTLGFRNKNELKEALLAVTEAHKKVDEGIKKHVYYSSYYIGNLLVLPNKTLHELLLENRPYTSMLLEAALSDVRAATIKIGEYYDVAPTYFYDKSLEGAIYYPAPSAPSLTVSEAAIVLHILAEVDPAYARVYEQQLADFTEQVFISGAHFASDIQASLDLAEIFTRLIKDNSTYLGILYNAQKEWDSDREVSARVEPIFKNTFKIKGFSYPTAFFIDSVINHGYKPTYTNETLGGFIMFTARDGRIPNATKRLYQYDWREDTILPILLDERDRQRTFSMKSLEQASYSDLSNYSFISQDETGVSVINREGSNFTALNGLEATSQIYNFESRNDIGKLVFTEMTDSSLPIVRLVNFDSRSVTKSLLIENATSPTIYDSDRIFFVSDNEIGTFEESTQKRSALFGIESLSSYNSSSMRKIKYSTELEQLVVIDTDLDEKSLISSTRVSLYSVVESNSNELSVKLNYSATFTDTALSGCELSPAGRYLACSTDFVTGEKSRILIFDIINGIIKKEIDLSDFIQSDTSLDGWVVF